MGGVHTIFPQSALEIRSSQGRQWFNIRIADNEARQEQGLMYVRALPADEGMLFPQAKPRVMTFWMKNTVIPLDLLFISAHGRIACLREQARPLVLDLITCDKTVKAVLEIGGGEARHSGRRFSEARGISPLELPRHRPETDPLRFCWPRTPAFVGYISDREYQHPGSSIDCFQEPVRNAHFYPPLLR